MLRRRSSLRALAPALPLLPALSLALFAACAVFAPRQAHAFERQWHVGADAGYAAFINPAGVTLHGFGGGLHLTYGISDTVNVILLADASVHPAITYKAKPVDGVFLAGGSAGFSYVFDVLQWVPYVGATAGLAYVDTPGAAGPRLAVQIPFGLDYQISRSFAVGAAGEYKLLFLDPAGPAQRFAGFVRAEYVWGY